MTNIIYGYLSRYASPHNIHLIQCYKRIPSNKWNYFTRKIALNFRQKKQPFQSKERVVECTELNHPPIAESGQTTSTLAKL